MISNIDKDRNQRQEARLNKAETIFIEVQSTYNSESACCMLICRSVDISANGIRAHIDEALPLHAIYQMCVELDADSRMYLAVQVKWLVIDVEGGSGFYVGLEILESDDTDIDKWKIYVADQLQREDK